MPNAVRLQKETRMKYDKSFLYIFMFVCGKLQSGAKYFLYQNKDFPIVLAVIELSKNMAITVVKKLVPMVSVVRTEKYNFKL